MFNFYPIKTRVLEFDLNIDDSIVVVHVYVPSLESIHWPVNKVHTTTPKEWQMSTMLYDLNVLYTILKIK